MCDKLCVELYNVLIIYHFMFPYNDEENAWLSKSKKNTVKIKKHSLIQSLVFALFAALFSTIIPPFIYFSKTNLF